jgi:hypothetical protein
VSPRPADWSPLCASDPTPGNPDGVDELAGRYSRTARAIESAAAGLRRIASDQGWKSDAGNEFREQAVEVAKEISKAERRYRETGQALATYAGALRAAQRRADAALERAKNAQVDLNRATAPQQGPPAQPPPDQPPGPTPEEQQRQRAAQAARSAIAAEQGEISGAISDRNSAADAAAAKIDNVSKHDGLKDGFWDNIAPVLKVIADVAGVIATVCGILSLLVGWIPVIGQALAGVLGTIALVASAIALVCHLALYLSGHGSLKDVIMDVISVASFGVGRLFLAGSKATAVAARASAWTNARNMVRAGQLSGRLRTLIGGRLAIPGGRAAAMNNASSRLWSVQWSGLSPGNIARGFAADWRTVSGNLGSLRTNPFTAGADAFRGAYQANGVQGIANTLWGNADLGATMAQAARFNPAIITDDVASLLSRAQGQNLIGVGGQATGSLADSSSAYNNLSDWFGNSPDVTAGYTGPAAVR